MPTAPTFAYHAPTAPFRVPRPRRARSLRIAGVVAAAVLFTVPFFAVEQGEAGRAAAFTPLTSVRPLGSAQPLGAQGEVTPAGIALEPASPFIASYGDLASALRAETCLTEAIYYEGALEPEAGQRAIAQVVLNRVRHPVYPNNVCGVVFQGQDRSTGCQFTFTCDGSRARPPVPSLWARANRVAKAALGGAVAPEVGLATHYHADYVMPYWSATLDQAGQIGRHIFYRWRGANGQPGAFTNRYAGREPLIAAWVPRAPVADSVPASALGEEAASGFAATSATQTLTVLPESAPAPAPTPFRARPLSLAGKAAGGVQ